MTTTIEISQMLDEIAKSADWHENLDTVSIARINQAAQRLRELDKPDCVWHKVGETFDTACNARYRDGAYSTWKTCPNCGGSVKASR